jgi:hypothetical protein
VPLKSNFLLWGIVLLAFLLRLTSVFYYPLTGDYAVHWQEAGNILAGEITLIGPTASMNQSFSQGPFYYYFLALLHFLTNGNDRLALICFALLNSLTIIPLFKICQHFFKSKITWIILLIYTINPYLIWIGGTLWNPHLIPMLVITSLYLCWKIKNQQQIAFLPSLFIILALISQCHITSLPVVIFLIYYSFDWRKWQQTWKLYLIGVFLFFLCWLPYFYYEFSHNWTQLNSLLAIQNNDHSLNCNFWWWLKNHGHGETCFNYIRNTLFIFREHSLQIFGGQNYFLIFLSGLMMLIGLWKKSVFTQLSFATFLTIFCFLFYAGPVYSHYFIALVPFGLLSLGSFLTKINNKKLTLIFAVTCVLLLWVNVSSTIKFLGTVRTVPMWETEWPLWKRW